jgi:hypothetical protein
LAGAAGVDVPLLLTLLPVVTLAAWPVIWWETLRQRTRMHRLRLRLG